MVLGYGGPNVEYFRALNTRPVESNPRQAYNKRLAFPHQPNLYLEPKWLRWPKSTSTLHYTNRIHACTQIHRCRRSGASRDAASSRGHRHHI